MASHLSGAVKVRAVAPGQEEKGLRAPWIRRIAQRATVPCAQAASQVAPRPHDGKTGAFGCAS